jgi:hypothetical protein
VGSKTFDGVWFISFSHDHPPPHVHGSYAETVVIVDLLPDGSTRESARWNAIQPANAKRGDIKHILNVAEAHALELKAVWEKAHGTVDG